MVDLHFHMDKIIKGELKPIDFPWFKLTQVSNALTPGSITLICGEPGCAKSFMALQMFANWHTMSIDVGLYELEKGVLFHLFRALAQITEEPGLANMNWIQNNPEQAKKLVEDYKDFITSFQLKLFASKTPPTVDHVLKWVREKAEYGCRIIGIDPISLVDYASKKPWEEDKRLLSQLDQIASDYGCSIVLITHPTKVLQGNPHMSYLAGSSAYARCVDTIIWLEAHEEKSSMVISMLGRHEYTHNRTLHMLKVRLGVGEGMRLAYSFNPKTLSLHEHGIIVKKD